MGAATRADYTGREALRALRVDSETHTFRRPLRTVPIGDPIA